MRSDVAGELDHDLVAIAKHDPGRGLPQPHAVAKDEEAAVLAGAKTDEPIAGQGLAPDGEKVSEPETATCEPDDARRIERPERGMAAGSDDATKAKHPHALDPDSCRHDHDPSVREELEMDAHPVLQATARGAAEARVGREWPSGGRVVGGASPDRSRHRAFRADDRRAERHDGHRRRERAEGSLSHGEEGM